MNPVFVCFLTTERYENYQEPEKEEPGSDERPRPNVGIENEIS